MATSLSETSIVRPNVFQTMKMANEAQKNFEFDLSKDYPFTPSTEEHRRLEEQSAALNDILLGKVSRAPVDKPKRIVDVGCGTGIQTVLLAGMYPDATVIGLDYSPVPDIHPKPDNVVYILGRLEELIDKHPLMKTGTFDLVYHRMLILAITDWSVYVARARSLLKPGGYIECQEGNNLSPCDGKGNDLMDSLKWPEVAARRSISRGLDIRIALNLPGILRSNGFEEVQDDVFPMAYRPDWKERPETSRFGRYFSTQAPRAIRMLLEQGADEDEDPDTLWQEAKKSCLEGEVDIHDKFHVIVARKSNES